MAVKGDRNGLDLIRAYKEERDRSESKRDASLVPLLDRLAPRNKSSVRTQVLKSCEEKRRKRSSQDASKRLEGGEERKGKRARTLLVSLRSRGNDDGSVGTSSVSELLNSLNDVL